MILEAKLTTGTKAERILNDSNVKLAIADDRERFDRLDSVIGRCPSLKHILMLDANAMGALEGLPETSQVDLFSLLG